MRREEIIGKLEWFNNNLPYKMTRYTNFDFTVLANIPTFLYNRNKGITYNDCIIMADTETSKKPEGNENHVVAWTLSIRALNRNIVTLYGTKPTELVYTIGELLSVMEGDKTLIYFHNLAYDYVFLRRFLFRSFGYPCNQLNTKSHYPVSLEWGNGLILRDSLILAQRSLDKWSKDMNVEHGKVVGKWDYDKLRKQGEEFTADELQYIEQDTLAGVECLQATMDALHKASVCRLPMTATGIPREDVRKLGAEQQAHATFLQNVMTYDQYTMCEQVYHGGYTHANRHELGLINMAKCYDFASSYPYCLLAYKYPSSRWTELSNKSVDYILNHLETDAFMLKFIAVNVHLKDDSIPMPVLQKSKCLYTINSVEDNGRILSANYVEIYINEMDLDLINRQYTWTQAVCTEVHTAPKEYLPRYLTDYIFGLYRDKTMLKGGDKVLYALAKAKLNSVYGMMVQKCIKETLQEDFVTGDYVPEQTIPQEVYDKYIENRNSILLYQWGVWCTSYAMHNLFCLGDCVSGTWLYSDTDSCYATEWDENKVHSYNEHCKDLLRANGYGCVDFAGREWWLGCAESDGENDEYTEYTSQGAKRYAGRNKADGEIHITVAGVPKRGAICLHDNLTNFRAGLVFSGAITGKLTHTYYYVDNIYTDKWGNETGDSIDLTPCDYLLTPTEYVDWTQIFTEDVEIQVYDNF